MQTTATINISLPIKLKAQADELVRDGYFSSFSDLVRNALRIELNKPSYDTLLKEVKEEEKRGESVILETGDDVDAFMKKV
jgi:Arc/MetJ-type ribon-helix-helix transcriptional regulator